MSEERPSNFERLLKSLSEASVDFIIVGGVAAAVHGSIRLTQDLDIVYRRTPENILNFARPQRGSGVDSFSPYGRKEKGRKDVGALAPDEKELAVL